MNEPKPPSDIYEQRFGIHTELDQRKLAKEAGIVGHLPRNNEQAIFLELISTFNRQSGNLLSRTGVPDAISYLRNIDYYVVTHPYSPLIDLFTLGDLFDRNIEVAKEVNSNRNLYSQLQTEEHKEVIGLLSAQASKTQSKFKVTRDPNGLFYTANPQNRSDEPGTPRISLSLLPKDGPEVAGKVANAVFEYLKEFPDLYMQFKVFQSDPFGFRDDLHIYFNPAQEVHVYSLLAQHLYPSIKGYLLGGGRVLPLPIYDAEGYQMRGVQFSQPLPGLSTAQTMDRLMSTFLNYYRGYQNEGEIEKVLRSQGYRGLRDNADYFSAVRQTSMRLSENGKVADENNLLVPAQFESRFPTFSSKTRYKEMRDLKVK